VWGIATRRVSKSTPRRRRSGGVAKGIQNGKPVVVFPVDGAQGKFVYPMPPR
jgi:hypothetical protein